jgi:uncharacterized protein (TIGR02246 family)
MLTRAHAEEHVRRWIDAWNANDVDAVLALFDPDFEFVSPKAQLVVGRPALKGRKEVGDYWRAALAKLGRVEFHLEAVTVDTERSEALIVYRSMQGGVAKHVAELLCFDSDGKLAVRGEAFYGAES